MTASISRALLTEIAQTVERNRLVRRNLPDGSRLHIERALPFLAVYRRPLDRNDAGTERLLLGEAAYLLATSTERHFTPLKQLVHRCAEIQNQRFGGFLLFELWTRPENSPVSTPHFRIVAPNHSVPKSTLEILENSLLSVTIAGERAKVDVVYQNRIHPPGLKPLYQEADHLTPLGLEIAPIYQSSDGSEIYPFELKAMHHALAQAFKRAFYTFIHQHTTQRPRHFQELGRKRFTQAVKECDRQLAGISQSFDLLLHITPVNAHQAWERFRHSGCTKHPEFLYRQRPIDPSLIKRKLFGIPLERIEDPTLSAIFSAKQEELDRQITLVADRNTPRFLLGSRQIYGDVDTDLLALAKKILQEVPPHTRDDHRSDVLAADEFAEIARKEVAFYAEQDPSLATKVEVRSDITGILVSKGNFLISTDTLLARARVEATLAHEIGTHALTYHNGRQQPLNEFHSGMAGYEPLQEGIAVLSEYLVGGLSRPRLRLLAGRVLAVHQITDGADFLETYNSLHKTWEFSQQTAYTIAMRVYRGGGYTKDAVYLKGVSRLLQYLAGGGDIETLLVGKITLEHLPFVQELMRREVLQPPRLLPRHLGSESAQQRLARLRKGATVLEMLEAKT